MSKGGPALISLPQSVIGFIKMQEEYGLEVNTAADRIMTGSFLPATLPLAGTLFTVPIHEEQHEWYTSNDTTIHPKRF